jgi:shikimate dehydrogenase
MDSRSPDTRTALYCVLGNPIGHSLSPAMHNRAFEHHGLNAVYLAFQATDLPAAVSGIRSLGIKGASITLPHKTRVMELLDTIDPTAAAIGAVNTIINQNGQLVGKNSDSTGATDALLTQTAIEDKAVLIIGAGGAARAIGFGIRKCGGQVTITNRSEASGNRLATDLGGVFLPPGELAAKRFDILINTTPVGMHPQIEASPVAHDILRPELVVMDIVYTPLETRLLKAAARVGCKTVDGLAMFVNQGARQFEWWTGEKAPVEVMRRAVLENLP